MTTLPDIIKMFIVGQKIIVVHHNLFKGKTEEGVDKYSDSESQVWEIISVNTNGKIEVKRENGEISFFDVTTWNHEIINKNKILFTLVGFPEAQLSINFLQNYEKNKILNIRNQ